MEVHNQSAAKRIVILGGGFGGAYCAKALERRLNDTPCEIYLIDKQNYFVFYPLLIEAGTGGIEPRHAVIPLRPFLRRTHFHTGEIQSVDTNLQKVYYKIPWMDRVQEIPFDHLVIAMGSTTRMLNIPGLREYGLEMKSLADAIALRDRAIQMLELAESTQDARQRTALLHFVIVGGNFTGVELAGQLQELLTHASRYYRHVEAPECRVTLLEITDRILPALDQDLSRYAAEHLSQFGVNIRLRTSLEQVTPDSIRLSTGEQLAANTVISCAGVAPNPSISKLSLPSDVIDPKGYILCTRDFRVRGFSNVWAVGDCAVNTDAHGHPYPQTAQHAVREARALAVNLRAVLQGQPPVPSDITTRGSIAAIGEHRGVARIGRFRLAGLSAWMINRAYYLWQLPGFPRKLRILFDWMMDLLFSRDYVQLGVHRSTAPPQETRRVA
jgi:NADH dehydrogenase